MRLPEMSHDFWTLRSGEESARQHPDTFHIPLLEVRKSLRRGQAAKLIFDIEGEELPGELAIQGEKTWVIVAERVGDQYVGILDSRPSSIEPNDNVYLCFGAEVPFLAEHVVDVADPPSDYVEWKLGQEPARRWPRTQIDGMPALPGLKLGHRLAPAAAGLAGHVAGSSAS